MQNLSKFEKEKLLNILECTDEELVLLLEQTNNLTEEDSTLYDIFLKILQQGYNIREATLSAIVLGERLGYKKAEMEMEEEIKEKLYRAFKNSQ
jgi:hypothetical protein